MIEISEQTMRRVLDEAIRRGAEIQGRGPVPEKTAGDLFDEFNDGQDGSEHEEIMGAGPTVERLDRLSARLALGALIRRTRAGGYDPPAAKDPVPTGGLFGEVGQHGS